MLAREDGTDVTLEVTSGDKIVGRADSPIPRTGIQHVAFDTREPADYAVKLVGKESSEDGRAQLRVLTYAEPPQGDICLDIQRLFAAADANFAVGQSVNRGTSTDPAADAASAYQAAAATYKTIARRLEQSDPSVQLAMAQHARASVLVENMQDWTEGILWAQRAARSYAAAGDEYGEARAKAVEAAALNELAVSPPPATAKGGTSPSAPERLAQARALLTTVASFHAQRGESYEQATALNYVGLSYYYEGLNVDAIRAYRRALPLFEALGRHARQALLLQNIAVAEYELGRFSSAINSYGQVLQLLGHEDSPWLFMLVLNNSAIANWASGNLDVALREHGKALEIARSAQQATEHARALQGIGAVYESLGDRDLALDYYDQALPLLSAATDGRGRASLLRCIANVLREQGRYDLALQMHREALSLASAPSAVARINIQIAKDLEALGRPDAALEEVAAVLRNAGRDEPVRALALLQRARLRMSRGMLDTAEADLRSSIRTFRVYEAPSDEFAAWLELARLKRRSSARREAFAALDAALALAEEVRLQSSSPELRATLMQPLRPAFELKISMLAEKNSDPNSALLGLMTAEQARARALEDFRNLDDTAPGVPAERVQQRRTLYKELAARRFQLERRLDRAGVDDNKVRLMRAEIAALRQQLDQIESEIGAASAAVALSAPRKGGLAVVDRRAVPENTAIVEYWLGADDAVAWVVTRERLEMIPLGATSRIKDAAFAFHAALKSLGTVPESRRLQLGQQLYALIIEPLGAFATRKTTLIFAPDGALHYVPFAALRRAGSASERFLVETHDIAVTASVNALLRAGTGRPATPPPRRMLLVDDPVYGTNDSRLLQASAARESAATKAQLSALALFRAGANPEALPRLPGSQREATAIAALLPQGEIDRLEGFEATRERFLEAKLGEYRFIHVASHAVTDSEIPQLSALVLATRDRQGRPIEGRVLAADLMNSQLRADAVVLSACDTALGKDVAGEGLVGLRYVVLARGARSVMASLWQVPDQVTAQLMTRFYSSLLRRGSSVVAASSAAMRSMIRGPFKDPALWAAFPVAIGTLQP